MPAWVCRSGRTVPATEWPEHRGRGCGPESLVVLPNVKELLTLNGEGLRETQVGLRGNMPENRVYASQHFHRLS